MSYSAEDEKRLLADAAQSATQLADAQTARHCSRRSACKRRVASVKRALNFAATLAFVVACSVMVLGLSSLAIGTMRTPWKNHGSQAAAAAAVDDATSTSTSTPAENAGPVVVADAAVPTTPVSPFSRLIEAVSPDTLHDLLHEYFPDMYKHGVYPSEKSALEVIHRKNAALATSIAQLARRDLNTTSAASVPASSVAVSSTPVSVLPSSSSSSSAIVTSTSVSSTSSTSASSTSASSTVPSTSASSASGTTTATSHTTMSTTATASTSSGKKVTSVYTSTINGTPTVVTATSVVGVAATNPTSTSTATGSLQTGAAMPLLSGAHAQLAKAVAGVVVGAMLI